MEDRSDYQGGRLSEVVINSLKPLLMKIKDIGIKKSIENILPGIDADEFVLSKIKNQLVKRREIELENGLGRLSVQYRYDGIQIECAGLIRLLVNKITITDEQIIKSFDNILSQIEEKYILDDKYILSKIDEIVLSLSETEIYKPETSEEKTLYDLAMLILINYYKNKEEKPNWLNAALSNISRGTFIKKWIEILAEYISEMISAVSEQVFLDFKITFDSFFVRTFLNKITNKGQISALLDMFKINVKDIIYKFSKSYVSPSFIRGASWIVADIAGDLVSNFDENFPEDAGEYVSELLEDDKSVFGITVTLGENAVLDRNFRWFTSECAKESEIEYSYDKNFSEKFVVKAQCERVPKAFPVFNFGLISSYKIIFLNKFSAKIKNLKLGKVYYRIKNTGDDFQKCSPIYSLKGLDFEDDFKFTVFADSQGMTKSDYGAFSEVFEKAYENEHETDFMVHLGDFVDDGNNEMLWKWLLESDVWKNMPIVPLSGNHDGRIGAKSVKCGVENSLVSHFYLENPIYEKNSKGAYFSFVYKNATFVVLNTNAVNSEDELDEKQYKWALGVAEKCKTKWKILLTHKSPYSNGPHHKDPDVKKIGKQIKKLAYYGNFDLVLGAHDHVYARTHFLNMDVVVKNKRAVKNKKEGISEAYKNPLGTVFVVPGTSGVKNYRQHFPIDFPAYKLLDIKNPVYSLVSIEKNTFCFCAYEFERSKKEFKLIDSFEINKVTEDKEISAKTVSRFIDAIPDIPWLDNKLLIDKALEKYNKLEYSEKVKVLNYGDLLNKKRINESYLELKKAEIRIVKNKYEFLKALKDKNVGTIITKCGEIKFDHRFFAKKFVIDRNLCITGEARILNAQFVVKEMACLTVSGNICIDNTKKPVSVKFAQDVIKMQDDSIFVLNENATISGGYGIGKHGHGISAVGENCFIYLNSSGYNLVNKGVVFAPMGSSKVVVTSGKYFSVGGNYAINTNGEVKLKGGFIRSVKVSENGILKVDGAIVGEDNKPKFTVPIEVFGKLILKSGTVKARDGVSVVAHSEEKTGNVNVLSKDIDIKGKILYNR